jgi:uncharacterized protein (TIGR02466 family)
MESRLFESTKLNEIFPTPVWVLDLRPEVYRPLNAKMMQALEAMTTPRPPINPGGTWQTDPFIHTLPQFAELTSVIRAGAKGALDFLRIEYGSFEITGCWANINPKGGLNTRHTHPNNFLSGTYYVQVPAGASRIVFDDPRPQAMTMLPRMKKYNKFVGNEIGVEVKAGRLVLFPAWLSHGVPANPDELERISVSFNIMFGDYTETMSRPLWRGTVGPRIA